MEITNVGADGSVTVLPEDDVTRLTAEQGRLTAELKSLTVAARSAAVLLRSTADRAESGQRIDPGTLRHAARALDDITAATGDRT